MDSKLKWILLASLLVNAALVGFAVEHAREACAMRGIEFGRRGGDRTVERGQGFGAVGAHLGHGFVEGRGVQRFRADQGRTLRPCLSQLFQGLAHRRPLGLEGVA